jgi:hypothetical protein
MGQSPDPEILLSFNVRQGGMCHTGKQSFHPVCHTRTRTRTRILRPGRLEWNLAIGEVSRLSRHPTACGPIERGWRAMLETGDRYPRRLGPVTRTEVDLCIGKREIGGRVARDPESLSYEQAAETQKVTGDPPAALRG